jgi:hypothetical protein
MWKRLALCWKNILLVWNPNVVAGTSTKDSNVCIKVFIHWSEVIQPWMKRRRRGQHLVWQSLLFMISSSGTLSKNIWKLLDLLNPLIAPLQILSSWRTITILLLEPRKYGTHVFFCIKYLKVCLARWIRLKVGSFDKREARMFLKRISPSPSCECPLKIQRHHVQLLAIRILIANSARTALSAAFYLLDTAVTNFAYEQTWKL